MHDIRGNFRRANLFRQTFGSNGVYGNYQFLYDQTKEADFYVAGNWTKKENILKENTIFLQQEPPEVKTPVKKFLIIVYWQLLLLILTTQ